MENSKKVFTTAIILAAGLGTRLGLDCPKQKLRLLNKSLLVYAVEPFLMCSSVDSIVVVTLSEDIDFANKELQFASEKLYKIVSGGACRAESARLGFNAIPEETTHIVIHDAARCLIHEADISIVISAAIEYGAASAVKKATDTVKFLEDGMIKNTVPRENLVLAQTPQVFEFALYERALDSAEDLSLVTDDNMLVENLGIKVKPVELQFDNPKITYQSDLEYAEFLLLRRRSHE